MKWKDVAAPTTAVCLAVFILAIPAIRHPGYPGYNHEADRYPSLLMHYAECIQAGCFFPRWLPNLAGGFGYPTFVFYQPLYFQVAAWLMLWFGLSAPIAAWTTTLLFAAVGAFGIYRLARLMADRLTSCFVTLVYALTPYAFVNVYVRGDWSEFAAMQLAPWCLYSSVLLVEKVRKSQPRLFAALGLSFSLAAIVLAHPLPAIAAWPVSAVPILCAMPRLKNRPKRQLLTVAGSCFVLGAALSSFYWLPGVLLRSEVRIDMAFSDYFTAAEHIVYPSQLLKRDFEFGVATRDENDTMSLQLGAAHLLVALGGLCFGRSRRLLWGTFVAYVCMIGIMLPLFAVLWDAIPLLRIMQFPWRLLSVIALLQATLATGWSQLPVKREPFRTAVFACLAGTILIWCSNQLHGDWEVVQFHELERKVRKRFDNVTSKFETFSGVHEFLPKTAFPFQHRNGQTFTLQRHSGPLIRFSSGDAQELPGNSVYRCRYRVVSEQPVTAYVLQFYFPGWQVMVDRKPYSDDELRAGINSEGMMSVELPACPEGCEFEAWYAGPRGGKACAWFGVLATLTFVVAVRFHDSRLS